MAFWILVAGLGLGFTGALAIALADAWLSRSLLVYLDAVEANLARVVQALRSGNPDFAVTDIDLKRDRGQDRARTVKTFGWAALGVGFALQIAAAWLARL